MKREGLLTRFERYAMPEPNSGCWFWMGSLNADGYGQICIRTPIKTTLRAHRLSYELYRGAIPPGLEVDHLCRVRCCVNPDHLEAVTPRVNTLRSEGVTAKNAQKTHCMRGHPLSVDNVKLTPTGRRCISCNRVYHRDRWRKRAKERAALLERQNTQDQAALTNQGVTE